MPDQFAASTTQVRERPADRVRNYRVQGNTFQEAPVHGGAARRLTPPPRPPVTSRLPLPGSVGPPPRPGMLTAAVALWTLAVVAGLLALIVSAIDSEALRTGLLADAHLDRREGTEQELVNGVVITMTTIALICDTALLLAVWGLRLASRRSRATVRVLVIAAVLTLLVVPIAQGMVAGGATELDRQAFLVQSALVLLATGALLTRPSRAWLRRDPD